ncbi:MAG: hypothetical protein WC100_02580 [Sterolibacterium sp.]
MIGREKAIALLQSALDAAVGEPVAWANPSMRVAFTQFYLDGFDDETRCKYSVPLYLHPAPNEWKDAVLDALAIYGLDAPTTTPPMQILRSIIDMAIAMAKDPSINEPARAWSDSELLTLAVEVGLFPNTIQSWMPALHRYTNAVLAARGAK